MDPAAAVTLWNTVPPILSRAEAYKTELKDAETLKYKLENKVGHSALFVSSEHFFSL
jgi:hypothetical protein